MKMLVTGANGQLGREICKLLGENAIATDLDALDITKPIEFSGACDGIINCAAYTNVDGAETDEENAYRLNVLGAQNLAEFAKKRNIPLVHVSTDYVFDGTANTPYTESDAVCPTSVYGKTKEAGEQAVRQYEKHFIVRTAWLYSAHGKNFVKTIMKAAREKGELKVVADQIGCPTNAKDLAKQILKLVQTREYGTYHCTGSGMCSWYDFAKAITEFAEIPCIVNPCKTGEFPTKASRPAYSVLDNSKAEKVTGFKMPDWQDSLKTFLLTELKEG